jgi:bisphosphoglycerate-dependent phosphoglycerate mutase
VELEVLVNSHADALRALVHEMRDMVGADQ